MGEFRTVDVSIVNLDDHLTQDRWAGYHRKLVALVRRAAMLVHHEWVSPASARVQSACVRFEISEDDVGELKHDLTSLAGEYGDGAADWSIGWGDVKPKLLIPQKA